MFSCKKSRKDMTPSGINCILKIAKPFTLSPVLHTADLLSKLRTCRNKCLAGLVALVLGEVLDES